MAAPRRPSLLPGAKQPRRRLLGRGNGEAAAGSGTASRQQLLNDDLILQVRNEAPAAPAARHGGWVPEESWGSEPSLEQRCTPPYSLPQSPSHHHAIQQPIHPAWSPSAAGCDGEARTRPPPALLLYHTRSPTLYSPAGEIPPARSTAALPCRPPQRSCAARAALRRLLPLRSVVGSRGGRPGSALAARLCLPPPPRERQQVLRARQLAHSPLPRTADFTCPSPSHRVPTPCTPASPACTHRLTGRRRRPSTRVPCSDSPAKLAAQLELRPCEHQVAGHLFESECAVVLQ